MANATYTVKTGESIDDIVAAINETLQVDLVREDFIDQLIKAGGGAKNSSGVAYAYDGYIVKVTDEFRNMVSVTKPAPASISVAARPAPQTSAVPAVAPKPAVNYPQNPSLYSGQKVKVNYTIKVNFPNHFTGVLNVKKTLSFEGEVTPDTYDSSTGTWTFKETRIELKDPDGTNFYSFSKYKPTEYVMYKNKWSGVPDDTRYVYYESGDIVKQVMRQFRNIPQDAITVPSSLWPL